MRIPDADRRLRIPDADKRRYMIKWTAYLFSRDNKWVEYRITLGKEPCGFCCAFKLEECRLRRQEPRLHVDSRIEI